MGYPSDLTDEQWELVEPIVTYKSEEELYRGGRPRTVDLRAVVNGLLDMDRTGSSEGFILWFRPAMIWLLPLADPE